MGTKRFEFQSGRQIPIDHDGGLPEAVQKTLEQFQRDSVSNMRRGEGSVVTTVTHPEEGVYFAVVVAGPFADLQTLRAGLSSAAAEDMINNLNRVGLE